MYSFLLNNFRFKQLQNKMVERTATEASNDFWLEFKAEREGNNILGISNQR